MNDYRKSPRKKSRLSSPGAAAADVARAAIGVWQPGVGTPYVARVGAAQGTEARMDQPIVRLIGFVVLVAIVLATGFGAIGAPLVVPGGF